MSLAASTSSIAADRIKLGIAGLIVVAAIWGFYFWAASPLIVRLGILLLGFAIAAGVAWTSEPGKRFYVYCQESIVEAKKVVWPTRKEAMQTTGVVVAFVIVMGLFLWLVDSALAWMLSFLIGRSA